MLIKVLSAICFMALAGEVRNKMAVSSSTNDKKFALLQEFFNLDERFRETLHAGLQKFLWNGSVTRKHPNAKKNIQLAGSAIEGASLARVFQKNDEFPSGLNQEIEVDIEFMYLKLPESKQDLIQDIEADQGYIKMKLQEDLFDDIKSIGWNLDQYEFDEVYKEVKSPEGYFLPFKIKSIAKKKVAYRDEKQGLRLMAAAVYNVKKRNVDLKPIANEITKSSVSSEYVLEVKGERKLKISFDTVVVVGLSWHSQIGNDWLNRPKNWPSHAVCQQILGSSSVVIAKPSRKNKFDPNTTEMRYAYSQTERKLVKLRSQNQNFVYMVFKIMFVKWIKPIDTEEISSFIAKTAMFWIAEEFPPENSMWDVVDSECLVTPLKKLFSWLLEAFSKDTMPYYFNEKSNIIEGMSDQTKQLIITNIGEVLGDLQQFIPSDIDRELAVAKDIFIWAEKMNKILTLIKDKNYKEALKILPKELILDIIAFYFAEIGWDVIHEKIEKELDRLIERAEKEIDRSLKKVEKELDRFTERAEKEIDRSSKKVENEVDRVKESVVSEVQRSGKKVEHEVNHVKESVVSEVQRSGKKVEHELKRLKRRFRR
uniref:Mab-21-like HhH/H2TH-like domain-containing protein n=1 Tax=Clytia hemisphaerica TaxID=252671 RepID=A0A7M5XD26_9CNID